MRTAEYFITKLTSIPDTAFGDFRSKESVFSLEFTSDEWVDLAQLFHDHLGYAVQRVYDKVIGYGDVPIFMHGLTPKERMLLALNEIKIEEE